MGKRKPIPSPLGKEGDANMIVVRDIEYAHPPKKKLLLDLYLPDQKSTQPFPVVVWIHGGAWLGGNKKKPFPLLFVQHGYAIASINYRHSTQATFPAQIYDCKAAIRWLRANAEKYNLHPDRIGVWGSSAGAHLAALLGTSGSGGELDGNLGNRDYSNRVQAVVDFYGPTDFLQMDAAGSKITHNAPDSPESKLIGGPIQENKEKVALANPITYVSEDAPPFLVVHGDKDRIVPYEQSQLLHSALINAGVESTFYILRGSGHGLRGKFRSPQLFGIVHDFLDRHLKNSSQLDETRNAVPKREPIILEY